VLATRDKRGDKVWKLHNQFMHACMHGSNSGVCGQCADSGQPRHTVGTAWGLVTVGYQAINTHMGSCGTIDARVDWTQPMATTHTLDTRRCCSSGSTRTPSCDSLAIVQQSSREAERRRGAGSCASILHAHDIKGSNTHLEPVPRADADQRGHNRLSLDAERGGTQESESFLLHA
jgi:hypothetical protein